MAHLMKCRKHSLRRMPLASCLTNSCCTYACQVSRDDSISALVSGWGTLDVGLGKISRYVARCTRQLEHTVVHCV